MAKTNNIVTLAINEEAQNALAKYAQIMRTITTLEETAKELKDTLMDSIPLMAKEAMPEYKDNDPISFYSREALWKYYTKETAKADGDTLKAKGFEILTETKTSFNSKAFKALSADKQKELIDLGLVSVTVTPVLAFEDKKD